MNHIINECYLKHGFPPWMKQRNNYATNVIEKEEGYKTENEKSSQSKTLKEQMLRVLVMNIGNNLWT